MSRLVAAELLKLRTTRTGWVVFLAALGLTLLVVVLTLALSDPRDATDVTGLLSAGDIAGLVILVLGIIGATGEHRHGTITATLLVTPARSRVVMAKAIAYALAGVAFTLAIDLAVAAVAVPWLSLKGAPGPEADVLGLLLLGSVVYGGLAGAIGVGVGSVIRNQAAALTIALVELLAIEPIVFGLAPQVGRFGPQLASSALLSAGEGGELPILPMWAGGLVLAGWMAIFVGAGMLLESRRDIA